MAAFPLRQRDLLKDYVIVHMLPAVQDASEMAVALKDRCPSKIDIGPVYTVDPQRRAAYQGGWLHGEVSGCTSACVLAVQAVCLLFGGSAPWQTVLLGGIPVPSCRTLCEQESAPAFPCKRFREQPCLTG